MSGEDNRWGILYCPKHGITASKKEMGKKLRTA